MISELTKQREVLTSAQKSIVAQAYNQVNNYGEVISGDDIETIALYDNQPETYTIFLKRGGISVVNRDLMKEAVTNIIQEQKDYEESKREKELHQVATLSNITTEGEFTFENTSYNEWKVFHQKMFLGIVECVELDSYYMDEEGEIGYDPSNTIWLIGDNIEYPTRIQACNRLLAIASVDQYLPIAA